jgi:hypothetical protein
MGAENRLISYYFLKDCKEYWFADYFASGVADGNCRGSIRKEKKKSG